MNSYFNKITSNINSKYKKSDNMVNKGLIGSIFEIIFYYNFGPFYHEVYFTNYNEKKNYVSLSLRRLGLWGHSYMGSIEYEIYDDTHYIFKEGKKKYDDSKKRDERAIEYYNKYKTGINSAFGSIAYSN